jgi:hypothetical protein
MAVCFMTAVPSVDTINKRQRAVMKDADMEEVMQAGRMNAISACKVEESADATGDRRRGGGSKHGRAHELCSEEEAITTSVAHTA